MTSYRDLALDDDYHSLPETDPQGAVDLPRVLSDGGYPPQYWREYDVLLAIARRDGTWAQVVNRRDNLYHVHGFVRGHGIVDSEVKADRRDALRAFIVAFHGTDALNDNMPVTRPVLHLTAATAIAEVLDTRDKANGDAPSLVDGLRHATGAASTDPKYIIPNPTRGAKASKKARS